MGAGLHPTSSWGAADMVDEPRYHEVAQSMRDLFGRTPEAALHVHVGMPDEETAIRVFNGLRRHLPLLIGLAANSPWWFGHDSGLASARWALVRSYPGRGIPPAFESWDHYLEHLTGGVRRRAVGLHARLVGRPPPPPARHRRGARAGRTVVAGRRHGDRRADAGARAARGGGARRPTCHPSEAIHWACFLAARDGLDAEIPHDGHRMPLRDAARRVAAELEVPEVEELVASGGGAGRRRAAHARGGVAEMLRELVEETGS